MPSATAPRVSMGMPVLNGEEYLEEAIRSLLAQSYPHFELIISDNASTDRTGEICRDFAAMDGRVRYHRKPVNVGFCRNQNSVIEMATAEYFLLTHHDDIRHPEYLARTVEVLDADRTVVVCYTKTRDIDERGRPLPREEIPLRLGSPDLHERFRDIIKDQHFCEADFGLTRVSVLRQTRLHGEFADSDRVLLAEMILHGSFHRIPEYLFFRRAHAHQSTAVAPDRHTRTIFFNEALRDRLFFPVFRQFGAYHAAIGRAPIGWRDRLWCRAEMLRWCIAMRRYLRSDFEFAARKLLGPFYHAVIKRDA
jgi:glycosyltransferase involved in cell wall biosynthesis